jgi:hypothetical protein
MRTTRSLLVRSLAIAVAVAATVAISGFAALPSAVALHGTWTVMTFEIADTNLEPDMMTDVGEMGKVGSTGGLNLISYVDRSARYSKKPVLGIPNWSGAKVLKIEKGGAEVLSTKGKVDTGDPKILAGFIHSTIEQFPAEHYALIISDHGASWPGVGADGSANDDMLNLAELDKGLTNGLAGTGVDKLDLLGFDACLMATYEVATTLQRHADRLLASQELEPGHGWDYSSLASATRGATVDQLGTDLIAGFKKQATQQDDESDITLSLLDLTKMPAIDTAMHDLSTALTSGVSDDAAGVGRALPGALAFGSDPDPEQDSFMKDLGELSVGIGATVGAVKTQATAVVGAIDDAIVAQVDGKSESGATGLSIYFPPTSDDYDPDYSAIDDPGGWASFLDAYYQAGAAIPDGAKPSFLTDDATLRFGDGGLYIDGTFNLAAKDSITDAYFMYGIPQADGSVDMLGDEPADFATDGTGSVEGWYDLTQLNMSDGEDTAPAYVSLTNTDDHTVTLDVPISYYPPDGSDQSAQTDDALLELVDHEGDITSQTFFAYDHHSQTYGELHPKHGGLLSPQHLELAEDGTEGWVDTSDSGLYSNPKLLTYSFDDLKKGTQLYVELWIEDFGGNTDYVSGLVTVP